MFLRLNAKSEEQTRKRLRMAGVEIEGAIQPEDDGVCLVGDPVFEENAIVVPNVVTVRKHAVMVSLNPRLLGLLGYMPGYATVLSAGWFGDIELATGMARLTESQEEQIKELEWLAKLHFIRVATVDD